MLLRRHHVLATLVLFLAAACTSAPPVPRDVRSHDAHISEVHPIQASQAVQLAAEAAPLGVAGVFELTVQETNRKGLLLFLDSERDYRDQRNLTVVVGRAAAEALAKRLHGDTAQALGGRHILVRGWARRVRIDFVNHHHTTGKYYYQTHVNVTDADQIEVL